MGFSLSDIFNPISSALEFIGTPVSWGNEATGALAKELGGVTGINELKRGGQTWQDISRDPMARKALGAAATYGAASYAAPYLMSTFAGAEPALSAVEMANLAEGAPLTANAAGASSITGASPVVAAETVTPLTVGQIAAQVGSSAGKEAATAWPWAVPAVAAGAGAATGAALAPEGSSAFTPMQAAQLEADIAAGEIPAGTDVLSSFGAGQGVKDAATGSMKWVGENPLSSLMVLNLLNSWNQANMMKGGNEAQQQSYLDYLKNINPTEEQKMAQLNAARADIAAKSTLTQKKLDETLAARGVRGKGKVAETGDLAEKRRLAENAAYNMIWGKTNVPTAPGPVPYAPSVGNLAAGSTAQLFAQELARRSLSA